jgi:arylsulfatase A-like enzyme
MIAELDDALGVVLAALERAGVSDRTLVWFLGDNGAGPEQDDANAPWRGHKGTLYEGALRVPAVVRWPDRIPAGGRISAPVSATDVFATTLQALGPKATVPDDLDGRPLLDGLSGRGELPPRELGFYLGQEGPQDEWVAIRTPEWKLVARGPDLTLGGPGPDHALELFAIRDDPRESADVADAHPDVVRELFERARAYRALQPAESIAPYWDGEQDFVAPREWRIPED